MKDFSFDFNRLNSIRRCIEKSTESDVCKYNALLALNELTSLYNALEKENKRLDDLLTLSIMFND